MVEYWCIYKGWPASRLDEVPKMIKIWAAASEIQLPNAKNNKRRRNVLCEINAKKTQRLLRTVLLRIMRNLQ